MESPMDESEARSSPNIRFKSSDFSTDDDDGNHPLHGPKSPNIRFSSKDLSDLDIFETEGHSVQNVSPNLRFLPEDFSSCDENGLTIHGPPDSECEEDDGLGLVADDKRNHDRPHPQGPNIWFEEADFSNEDDFKLNISPGSSPSGHSSGTSEAVRGARYDPPQQYTEHANPPGTLMNPSESNERHVRLTTLSLYYVCTYHDDSLHN